MRQPIPKNRRRAVGLLSGLSLAATLLVGCMTFTSSGLHFDTMTREQHLHAACRLEQRAAVLDQKYDPSAGTWVHAGRALLDPDEQLMKRPAVYKNPTERYRVMAQELRSRAAWHLAAARRSDVKDDRVCDAAHEGFTSYGGTLFWW